jgi:hypothetical protein
MRELVTKIGRFGENHVEKIVLVLVSGVCVWLFFSRVIFSPDVVTYDKKTFTPGRLDRYVYEQKAQELKARLQQRKAAADRPYRSPLTQSLAATDPLVTGIFDRPLPGGFAKLFEAPLSFITPASLPKMAPLSPVKAVAGRQYRLPLIPDVTDVATTYLRAAAYVPLQEVTPQNTYDKAQVEPNDLDLITVEAKFNTAELYRQFQACFNGVDVLKEEWRDPCLAEPVFAAVQLQRQEWRDDGTWSDWTEVPRSRIEPHQKLFEVIEKAEDLPAGGLGVRMIQFHQKTVTMELLQPESYQIASPDDDWFPPSFYDKYRLLQKRMAVEERRQQAEQERNDRNAESGRAGTAGRGGLYGGQTARGTRAGVRSGPGTGDALYGGQPQRGGRGGRYTGRGDTALDPLGRGKSRAGRRGGSPEDQLYGDYMMGGATGQRRQTTDEAYIDFGKVMMNYTTDLSRLDQPLLIWAFDDTAAPGGTYRYRMRAGVFNPVAGTDQLVERDRDKKDQVILWSRFSEVTEPVEVRHRLYLFAKDVQGQTKTATVEVARYALGYWHTENFQVRLGEVIGREVEPKPERTPVRTAGGRITNSRNPMLTPPQPGGLGVSPGLGGPGMGDYMMGLRPDQAALPTKVDYTTGKVLVDLVQVSDLSGGPSLRPRTYYDMLYTADGTYIEHMPASMTNWSENLLQTYQYVQSEREKGKNPPPFRAFNKGGLRGRRGGMPGMYPGMGGGYDEGMMDMPGGEGGAYGPYP